MTVKHTLLADGTTFISCDDSDPYEAERRAAYKTRVWDAVALIRKTRNDLRPVLLALTYGDHWSVIRSDKIRAHLRRGVEIPPPYDLMYSYVLARKDARRALELAGMPRHQVRQFFTSMRFPHAIYEAVMSDGGLCVGETRREATAPPA